MINFTGINSYDSPIHTPPIFWKNNTESLSSNDESSETFSWIESRHEQAWIRIANALLADLNPTDQELKGFAKECETQFSSVKKMKLIVWSKGNEKELIHSIRVSKYSWAKTVKKIFGSSDEDIILTCKRRYKFLTRKSRGRKIQWSNIGH